MKHLVLTTALSLALAGPLAFAQQESTPPPPPSDAQGGPMHHHAPDPHREAMRMKEKLNLTPDQTAKIEPILADRETRMQALHSNSSLTGQQMHEQMRSIHEDTQSKLAAVLTPDQLTELKSMRGHRGPGGSGGRGEVPPPPSL